MAVIAIPIPGPPFPGGLGAGLYGLLQLGDTVSGRLLINRLMTHQVTSGTIRNQAGNLIAIGQLWAAGTIATCNIPADPVNEPTVNLTAGMLTGWINNAANPLPNGVIHLLNASSWTARANGTRTIGVHVLGAVHFLIQTEAGQFEVTRLLNAGFHQANPERDVSHLYQPADIGGRRTIRACIETHNQNMDRIACRVFNRTVAQMTIGSQEGGCICGASQNPNQFQPICMTAPGVIRTTVAGQIV